MAESDADERLLVDAAQRDSSKFGDLYERHFDRVYAFVARRVRDRDAAEDVTAEVFHKALASLGSYQWRGAPFGAWLIRIAANALTDRSRRAAREVVDSESVRDHGVAPADLALIDERARLFRLVDRLPADQRTVIVQRFVDGRSIREIARQMKKTDGAIKQLQFRALHTLRTRMEDADA